VQGGECAAVRALQAGANAATRRFWQPKTHLFMDKYLVLPGLAVLANRDDRLRPTLRNRFVTVVRVVGAVATDARDHLLNGNLVCRQGSIGASPVALSVTSMARIFTKLSRQPTHLTMPSLMEDSDWHP
jgi:hypothetical protein